MEKKDVIMIFQKPELYFFPEYQEVVFSPFGVKERGAAYWVYKFLYWMHLPQSAFFWGEWKKKISDAKKVIIFDYGYQRGMEQYIKKVNPECEVYLFYWNIITPQRINYKLFTEKDHIYSTDIGDCKTYGFRYQSMFYTRKYLQKGNHGEKGTLFFLGADKGRGWELCMLKKKLEHAGIRCDIQLLPGKRGKKYREEIAEICTERPLNYTEYRKEIENHEILLDFNQKGQTAPSMRVMEAVFLGKKLITNNRNLKTMDFYQENNIFILPDQWDEKTEMELQQFLAKPFVPYEAEIIDQYDWENWKENFR